MKKLFFDNIGFYLKRYPQCLLILCGLGYPRYSELKKSFPTQVINTEASEQTALDMAVGLAYGKKIPWVYTITPFFLRGFETIRTYINHEQLNVKLVGAGRGDDYGKHDGFSHDATDMPLILSTQKHIMQWYPKDGDELIQMMDNMVRHKRPDFLSLTR